MKSLLKYFLLAVGLSSTSVSFAFDMSSPPNSLVVDSQGEVGVGTDNPTSSLHVKTQGAQVRVEDDSGSSASRVLLSLVNNGAPLFQLANSSTGKIWDFSQTTVGDFTISKSGSGGFEFRIFDNGRVRMGPGATTNFDLQAGGDLIIPNGSVIADGILLTSSRASKTDFSKIKTADVMEKLKKIEVEEWRYKKAEKDDRHFSPMAEDFYSLFQLGPDNKHINPNDLASVALIAAKELQRRAEQNSDKFANQTKALKAKNSELEKQLTEQKERLASLEKLVTNLVSANNGIEDEGEKVALNY